MIDSKPPTTSEVLRTASGLDSHFTAQSGLWDKERTGFDSYEDYMEFAELAVRAAVHSQLDR
jgi:hypothetical protein